MLGISVWAFVEPAILNRVFEKLTLPPLRSRLICAIWAFCSMRNGNNGPTKISRSWESRGVYSGKGPLQLLAVVLASLLIVSSALAGELGALCSAAKNFVSTATTQEGILITYPTASEFAASTIAYAAAKERYFSEFRSAMPILIAIGLKQRPETGHAPRRTASN